MATTAQGNKEIVRRFIEDAWNEANLELVDELVAADAKTHDPTLPERPDGPDGHKRAIRLYHSAFPDAHIDVEGMIAEGDTVAVRFTGTGTHEGELMGIEPTGAEVEISGMEFRRVEDEQIVETWAVYDTLGMLQQIGAVPEQPAG